MLKVRRDIETTIQNCFHPRSGKANIVKVKIEDSQIRDHMDKAQSNLRAMVLQKFGGHST